MKREDYIKLPKMNYSRQRSALSLQQNLDNIQQMSHVRWKIWKNMCLQTPFKNRPKITMAWSKNVQGHSLTRTFHLYICTYISSWLKKWMWWDLNYRLSYCKSVLGACVFERIRLSFFRFSVWRISLRARVVYLYCTNSNTFLPLHIYEVFLLL